MEQVLGVAVGCSTSTCRTEEVKGTATKEILKFSSSNLVAFIYPKLAGVFATDLLLFIGMVTSQAANHLQVLRPTAVP